MQIETHQMDPRIARIHYLDYRKKVRAEREKRKRELHEEAEQLDRSMVNIRIQKTQLDKEDDELIMAYKKMAMGCRVLLIHQAMKKAGVDKHYLPRLAICRADAEWCWCTPRRRETTFSAHHQYGDKDQVVSVYGEGVFPAETWNWEWRKQHGHPSYPVRALVPKIPPMFRPSGNLGEYHILWEATWENIPPIDPVLLKRVSATVFVVLAEWDLTPLERAVLEGRPA